MSKLPQLGLMGFGRGKVGLDLALDAEARGFDSIWTADGNGGDALTHAGALGAVLTRASLGTAIALRVRSPLQAVFGCSLVDDLTNGKFVFGLGAGPKERMEDWHGLQHDPTVGRMREYVELMQAIWESPGKGPVTYEGRFYRVQNYIRPATSVSARLPIYLGCAGPLMTRLAGEIADGLIVHVLHSIKMVRDQTRPEVEKGAKRSGRSLDSFKMGVGCFTAVDPDRETAVNRARHQILWALTTPYNPPLLSRSGFASEGDIIMDAMQRGDHESALRAITDDMVDELTICGTPDEVRTRLAEWGTVVDLVTSNGIGAYMNVVPEAWRLPPGELVKNQEHIRNLLT